MSVKDTVRQQHVRLVDRAAQELSAIHQPKQGWLVALRKALGMSGADVASRAGVSRGAIYQAERNEPDGAITISQLRKLADAMDGELVYAVVPRGSVDAVIHAQARRKAEALVRRTSAHMALESQALAEEQNLQRIEDLTEELIRDMPPDFWKVK